MESTPTLLVPRRVLSEIIEESRMHPENETGAAMIGIEQDGLMIVLGIIPDKVNIERYPGLFKNGGGYQVGLFNWYNKHWNMMRKKSRTLVQNVPWTPSVKVSPTFVPEELDLNLSFLGDWHKHPGNMTHLSGTDRGTIRDILLDNTQNRTQLLSPIVTFYRRGALRYEIANNEIVLADGDEFKISWYYSNRTTTGLKPIKIKPFVVSDDTLPHLPPIPWHLTDPERLDNELLYLGYNGYNTSWRLKDTDNDGICEVIFLVDHPLWRRQVLVITKWDYPRSHASVLTIAKEIEQETPVEEPQEQVEEAHEEAVAQQPETVPEVQEVVQETVPATVHTQKQPSGISSVFSFLNRRENTVKVPKAKTKPEPQRKWTPDVHIVDIIQKLEDQLL